MKAVKHLCTALALIVGAVAFLVLVSEGENLATLLVSKAVSALILVGCALLLKWSAPHLVNEK